jgi:methionyl-tRNA synthetase
MEDFLFDFISLNVKCPLCEESLMDEDNLVDGRISIRLEIETQRGKGIIQLSSIYESYNYRCDIEVSKDEIVKFICPKCQKEIKSNIECEYCGAMMVLLDLDIGGKVSICSRAGCMSHFLEFEDIASALKKLYNIGDYKGTLPEGNKETGESKEIIETGTFLNTYCPKCHKALIEKSLIKLKIINELDEEGLVFLSPYLNVFTSRSTVFLKEDKIVKDIICFHCGESLIEKKTKCAVCGSPAAKISVSAKTKYVDFYICSKKGCRWHGLNKDDLHDIELEDSLEW